jgi:hypothetical protein
MKMKKTNYPDRQFSFFLGGLMLSLFVILMQITEKLPDTFNAGMLALVLWGAWGSALVFVVSMISRGDKEE